MRSRLTELAARFVLAFAGTSALFAIGQDESVRWNATENFDPGSSFAEIASEAVLAFRYQTALMDLTAHRADGCERFAVDVRFVNATPPQHCVVSPNLGGVLREFAKIDVVRSVGWSDAKARYPIALGTISIGDPASDPYLEITFRARRDRRALVVLSDFGAFETTVPVRAFDRLGAGCAALSIP